MAHEVGRTVAGLALAGWAAPGAGQEPPRATPAVSAGATRERALRELEARVSEADRLAHAVAVEAIMRGFAGAADGSAEEWGLAGLLHDIDLAETKAEPSQHGVVGARLLAKLGFSEAVVRAVASHDDAAGVPRTARIDHKLTRECAAIGLTLEGALQLSLDAMRAVSPRPR